MNGPSAAVVAKVEAIAEFAPTWVKVALAVGGLVLVVDGLAALRGQPRRNRTPDGAA